MKKVPLVCLLLALVISQVACGSGNNVPTPDRNTQEHVTGSESQSVTPSQQSDGPQNAAPFSWPTADIIESAQVQDSSPVITADDLVITLRSHTVTDEGNGWSQHEVIFGVSNKTDSPLFVYIHGGKVYTNLDVEYPLTQSLSLYLPARSTVMGTWDYDSGTWVRDELAFYYRIPSTAEPTEYEISVFSMTNSDRDLTDLFTDDELKPIVFKIQPDIGQVSTIENTPVTDRLPYEYTQSEGKVVISVNSVDRGEDTISVSLSITNLDQTADSSYSLPHLDILYEDGYWGKDSTAMMMALGVVISYPSKIIGPGQTLEERISLGRDPSPETGIHIFMLVQDDSNPVQIIVFAP